MNEPEVFPNAPITEAVLDIRVTPDPGLELSSLRRINESISDRFPQVEGLAGLESQVLVARGKASTQASVQQTGFLFRSADQSRVVQVTQTGFTFNRLKPYDRWEPFRNEAKQLWQQYVGIANPQSVDRIALRYINRIELPVPFNDFREYVLTTPEVAPGISQGLAHFFMRLEIPYPELSAVAIVITAMERTGPTPSTAPLIFDIDVFRVDSFDPNAPEIWEGFEALRRLKNEVFFNSITPKSEELFR